MVNKEVILFHGWGGSKKSLSGLGEKLQELGYKIHLPEMPGHGNTSEMMIPWDMELFGKWATQVIEKSAFKEPILLGHSFGGKILLELAVNGQIANDLILINSSGIKPELSTKQRFFKSISSFASLFQQVPGYNALRNFTYKYGLGERDYINTSGNLKESFKLIISTHYDTYLENIENNCLIIWGKEDKDTPLEMGKKLSSGIKNSKLFKLEGTHGLPLHSPDKVAKIISSHYSNL